MFDIFSSEWSPFNMCVMGRSEEGAAAVREFLNVDRHHKDAFFAKAKK